MVWFYPRFLGVTSKENILLLLQVNHDLKGAFQLLALRVLRVELDLQKCSVGVPARIRMIEPLQLKTSIGY